MFLGKVDDLLEKVQIHHFGGRIVGVADNQQFGARPCLACGAKQVLEKILARPQRYAPYISARDGGRVMVNRIGRIGCKDNIPRADGHQHQVRNAFLDTNGGNGFGIRIDIYVKPPLVPTGNGFA